jgi:hypothetical protein
MRVQEPRAAPKPQTRSVGTQCDDVRTANNASQTTSAPQCTQSTQTLTEIATQTEPAVREAGLTQQPLPRTHADPMPPPDTGPLRPPALTSGPPRSFSNESRAATVHPIELQPLSHQRSAAPPSRPSDLDAPRSWSTMHVLEPDFRNSSFRVCPLSRHCVSVT